MNRPVDIPRPAIDTTGLLTVGQARRHDARVAAGYPDRLAMARLTVEFLDQLPDPDAVEVAS